MPRFEDLAAEGQALVEVGGAVVGVDVATQAELDAVDAAKAPLASPALTGTPTVPTAPAGTNTTQAASTAFVMGEVGNATSSEAMLGNFLTVGEENMPRDLAQGQPALGNTTLVFSYFTARKSHTITQLRTVVGTTASAGATLCRMGLYSVAANGDLTLVAACANDTTLWSGSTGTVYTRSITGPASYGIVKGQRYACAALCVGASPTVHGASPIGNVNTLWTAAPAIAGGLATQQDLPASVLGTSVAAAPRRIYMEMLP